MADKKIIALAEEIHNALLDMDFMDYADTMNEDLKNLENDLELLQEHGNGALMYALEMLTENF